MPEISSLTRQKLVATQIDLGDGDTVTVTFDRNKVTPAWTRTAEQRETDRDTLALPAALADVIIEWDVTSDGQPFPPTVENMSLLSYPTQRALLQEVLRAAIPGEAEGKASSVPTSTPPSISTEPPATSPNGMATSQLPAPSASPSPT